MISELRGKLIASSPNCVVDVGGVGFEVMVPAKDVERFGPDDSQVHLYTYLYVREDRLNLFGFQQREDRDLFLRLIDVSGIGPRVALAMFANHDGNRLVTAIRGGDIAFLKSLQGLGKKTAERLVMELGDKLVEVAPAAGAAGAAQASSVRDEVLGALTSLGMNRGDAELAVQKLSWPPDDKTTVEELVREALRYASSG